MRKTRILILRGLLSIFALLLIQTGFAQTQRTVTGKVTDSTGAAIPNVSVQIQGKTTGVVTDLEGNYSIRAAQGDVLTFSSVGFQSEYGEVAGSGGLNITLRAGVETAGDEVVVTALGVRRQTKSLGYAVQEIKGETLTGTREPNIANSLTGQVAGLQVVRSSNGPGGSSKIVLRGFNSLTGDNQPLIVIDGVPMNNFTGQTNTDYWNPSLDMGNGLSDLNSEDIASLTVLKGPSAAALYGTRAGNGVILITTKTGRVQQGVGITVSSSVGFERPFMMPEMQSIFGQGTDATINPLSGSSWGPKISGQTYDNWNGVSTQMALYDNVANYMQTGIISNQNISFQQMLKGISVYSSYNRVDNTSMIPGSKLIRNNFMTRAVSKMANDRLTLDAKVQFNNTEGKNRPLGGPDPNNNTFAMLYLFPRSLDIRDFSNPLRPNGTMLWYGTGNGLNPYWTREYRLNEDVRDRYLLNASLKYDMTDWLSAELKAGGDLYTTSTNNRTYGGSPLTPTGRFSMGKETFQETNYSAMVTAKKDNLVDKFGASLMLGGNIMSQKYESVSGDAGELEVPNLFSLNNSIGNPGVGQGFRQRKINSVFASAQVNYDGYFFIDATFRNDWSSTLSKRNSSFFYPSISASFVFSDLLNKNGNLPAWMDYGKIRASYATVGNDLGPYQLLNTYWIGKDPNGITNAGRNTTLYDENVKSELIKNIELGTELRFLQSRLSVDFSYYKSNATNQLIGLPMDPLSGYARRMINAGNIQNEGFELVLTGRILQNPEGFNWTSMLNVSRNRNKIVELSNALDITQYQLGGFDDLRVMAVTGRDYGDIYGIKYRRVEDKTSPHFGKIIVNADGLPLASSDRVLLGNQQANALLGWTNTFSYKNLSLSFLIDGRFGGQIFSGTNWAMQAAGTAAATVVNGERAPFVFEGVYQDANGNLTLNDVEVTPQRFWTWTGGITANLGVNERNIYDATNIRIRNIQLNYQLPKQLISKAHLQNVKVGVSCNNVLMLRSHLNGIDPESVFAVGTNAVGFENLAAPTSRIIFLNLAVTF